MGVELLNYQHGMKRNLDPMDKIELLGVIAGTDWGLWDELEELQVGEENSALGTEGLAMEWLGWRSALCMSPGTVGRWVGMLEIEWVGGISGMVLAK